MQSRTQLGGDVRHESNGDYSAQDDIGYKPTKKCGAKLLLWKYQDGVYIGSAPFLQVEKAG